jgi:hypothetical protein
MLFPDDGGMGLLNLFKQYSVNYGFDQGDDRLDLNVVKVPKKKPMSVGRTDFSTSKSSVLNEIVMNVRVACS